MALRGLKIDRGPNWEEAADVEGLHFGDELAHQYFMAVFLELLRLSFFNRRG